VFPARYELNSYIVFRKRLVSKRLSAIHIAYVFSFSPTFQFHFRCLFHLGLGSRRRGETADVYTEYSRHVR
jgi:hypothetical protein